MTCLVSITMEKSCLTSTSTCCIQEIVSFSINTARLEYVFTQNLSNAYNATQGCFSLILCLVTDSCRVHDSLVCPIIFPKPEEQGIDSYLSKKHAERNLKQSRRGYELWTLISFSQAITVSSGAPPHTHTCVYANMCVYTHSHTKIYTEI